MKRFLIGAAAAALLGLGSGGGVASAEPLARIAFSDDSGIQVLRADGSARTILLKGQVGEPTWSPDGTLIAYSRLVVSTPNEERTQIWVMRSDGTGQRPVTPAPGKAVEEASPAWSPDGRQIVFARARFLSESLVTSLVVIPLDGSAERTLLTRVEHRLNFLGSPAWSPDGKRIIYTRTTLDNHAYFRPSLHSIPAVGGGASLLLADAGSPSFSPDGTQIAFVSIRDRNGSRCGSDECNYAGEIYVMNADGTAQRRLTSEKGDDENPAWSPDGKHIAFDSDRNYPDGESHELYSIRPDGSCLTWLTNGSASSGDPTWEPGIGLSSDPRSCGPVQRTPLIESQPPPRGPLNVPMYWLGPVGPGSLLLSLVQVDRHFAEIDYDDCALFDPGRCGSAIDLIEMSACLENPLTFLDPAHVRVLHGTLVQAFNVDPNAAEDYDIFAGATTIRLVGPITRARLVQIAALLRPVGADVPAPAFPRPALPKLAWRALDRVVAAQRRLHSIGAVARALHTRPLKVRERLQLASLLTALGRRRILNCPTSRAGRPAG